MWYPVQRALMGRERGKARFSSRMLTRWLGLHVAHHDPVTLNVTMTVTHNKRVKQPCQVFPEPRHAQYIIHDKRTPKSYATGVVLSAPTALRVHRSPQSSSEATTSLAKSPWTLQDRRIGECYACRVVAEPASVADTLKVSYCDDMAIS